MTEVLVMAAFLLGSIFGHVILTPWVARAKQRRRIWRMKQGLGLTDGRPPTLKERLEMLGP